MLWLVSNLERYTNFILTKTKSFRTLRRLPKRFARTLNFKMSGRVCRTC